LKDSPAKSALKEKLFAGSSVENPIDFLATGTAAQLGEIIDSCENDFDFDGMAVIFGSPGLFPIGDVYASAERKNEDLQKTNLSDSAFVNQCKRRCCGFSCRREM
jgi:acetate---CoA ligase (ADP-forming)